MFRLIPKGEIALSCEKAGLEGQVGVGMDLAEEEEDHGRPYLCHPTGRIQGAMLTGSAT